MISCEFDVDLLCYVEVGVGWLQQKLYLCNTIRFYMNFSEYLMFCPHCGSAEFNQSTIKSKRCTSCGFTFYMNPSAAVAAFITDEEGRLLVCRRAKEPAKGTYDLPGGFVDANETAEQAIGRELYEELSAEVLQTKFLFSLPNSYLYSGLTIPTLDIFFQCKLKSSENMQAADDVAEFLFISRGELNEADFGLQSIRKAISIYKNDIRSCE